MKKHYVGIALLAFGTAAYAENGLWTEGRDRPQERVNADLKTLSPDAFMKVAEKVDEAVVNISTTQKVQGGGRAFVSPFGDDFFERFFGAPPPAPREERRQSSLGSGFILNPEGYILTNNHVVERAEEIRVILSDESELKATVVGRDPRTDVALLKVESPRPLKGVILGDSDELKVGEVVLAIGNPFGLSHTLTQGIVSAKERSIGRGAYDDFIQTDASINPGNSGGPLLNLRGEVVGINTAIVASGQGIGFAIPINLAKTILLKLKTDGKVVRGWLGVVIQKVTPEHARALKLPNQGGALVSEVAKDGPAQKGGLKAGDVIVRFKGREIKNWHELPIAVAESSVGEKAAVEVIRDGAKRTFAVEIAELEDPEAGEGAAGEVAGDPLGLRVEKLTPETARSLGVDPDLAGVVISSVDPDGAAAAKGLRRGDILLEVNRTKIRDLPTYRATVAKLKKGSSVLLLVKRGPSTQFLAFTL